MHLDSSSFVLLYIFDIFNPGYSGIRFNDLTYTSNSDSVVGRQQGLCCVLSGPLDFRLESNVSTLSQTFCQCTLSMKKYL